MADREDMSIGVLTITDRARPAVAYTVAKPPANPRKGDLAYFSNGNAGAACWSMYDGTNWKVVSVGNTAAAE